MRIFALYILLLSAAGMRAQAGDPVVEIPLPAVAHSLLSYDHVLFAFTPSYAGAEAWEIEVHRDRTGSYKRKGAANGTALTVSDTTLSRLSAADASKFATGGCETKAKNIAKTGVKTIAYSLGPSLATCTFNYSDDAAVNDAASAFLAVAQTMQTGELLKQKKRFDHLGLDAVLDSLVSEAKAGRAIELQNIAPILTSIAQDDELMSMVRRKATGLLQMAGVVLPVADNAR